MMKNNQEFELAIESFSPEMKNITRETRKLIHQILPELVEVVWMKQKNIGFGSGPKNKTKHFCWLMPASRHVSLGFNFGQNFQTLKTYWKEQGNYFDIIRLNTFRIWRIRL